MKKIVVVLGSVGTGSLGRVLAQDYRQAAEAAGAAVTVVDVPALDFDPALAGGLDNPQPLEPDLSAAQKALGEADHLVFIYPNWWGTYPARLKGFIDRTFLPGFAFQYRKGSPLPEKLLTGKTARIIVTLDGPGWWYRWAMGAGGDRALRRSVLWFCGVKTLGTYHADRLRPRKEAPVERHQSAARALGRRDAR